MEDESVKECPLKVLCCNVKHEVPSWQAQSMSKAGSLHTYTFPVISSLASADGQRQSKRLVEPFIWTSMAQDLIFTSQ